MYLKISAYALLLATCHLSLVTGKVDSFNYFYNKFHRDNNSTGIPNSVLDILFSNQENNSTSKDNFINGTDEGVSTVQHGPGYNSRTEVNIALIAAFVALGIIIVGLLVGCCIGLCCPSCFRRQKAGYIVGGFNPNVGIQVDQQQTVFPRSASESHLNQFPPPSYSTLPPPQQFSRSQNNLPQFTSSQLLPPSQNLPVEPLQTCQQSFIQQSAMNPDTHNPPYAPSVPQEFD